ncbi:hypothetical protein F5X96DRAFT_66556 [Biscogniauxia mediterranea]|nr:hypothetical protein F5X96DRAFT_66556 [Biscogniauxia mediterranea]
MTFVIPTSCVKLLVLVCLGGEQWLDGTYIPNTQCQYSSFFLASPSPTSPSYSVSPFLPTHSFLGSLARSVLTLLRVSYPKKTLALSPFNPFPMYRVETRQRGSENKRRWRSRSQSTALLVVAHPPDHSNLPAPLPTYMP